MPQNRKLKIIFYAVLMLLILLVSYKIYLYIFETDFFALNVVNIDRIEKNLNGSKRFNFAVIGNINNSIGVFDKKIINMLNQDNVDFLISSGNAVSDGAEDKYRILYRSLKKLSIPYVMAFGDNEKEGFGARLFYRHFGPFFFSFQAGDCLFIFLDSSGETSLRWQQKWLVKQLRQAQNFQHRFIIINRPPFKVTSAHFFEQDKYLENTTFCKLIQNTAVLYSVDAVFSSNFQTFSKKEIRSVPYYVSGGGGGLIINDNASTYHYLKVVVTPDSVSCHKIEVARQTNPLLRKIENLWVFIHSIFYAGMLNFLLLLSLLGLVAINIYGHITRQKRLYRNFDRDEEQFFHKKLNIVHFTNNYLPFIGGVPLSIQRLCRSLMTKGHNVKIIAPSYRNNDTDHEERIYRCPAIISYKKIENFPIVNPFSPALRKIFCSWKPDIVHIHHPYWLGRTGLRLAKRAGVPVIYTYHTRFEKYAHYVPIPGIVFKNILAHYIVKNFAMKCDGVIVPTYSAEEYLRNLGVSTMVETIPTGLDTTAFENVDLEEANDLRRSFVTNKGKLLVSVARLSPEKNLYFLLDALKQVQSQARVKFHCLIIGDGMERKNLEKYAEKNGLTSIITFTGKVMPEKMPLYYTAADLFVFTSTSETQGMVLLEAMAGGCPVVAVRSSGIADVIKNGITGFKTRENATEWAKTIAGLLEDDRHLAEMSTNAKRFASKFSEDKIADRVLDFYARILAKKNERA
ncbi:MAG: glycosyltransferase [Syntrophobacterales bacterium]|nr:glycosyltransferase [Syntrophobacterales bacterium]